MAKKQTLAVDGQEVPVSNLDKLLYPSGFTKSQVIDYYIKISPSLLPHLKDRPVTMKRYPDGVKGEFFYEKEAPKFTPKWVKTFPVPRQSGVSDIHYILIDDLPTLVWCANLANLELHPFLHRAPHIDRPASVVFDLDPGEGTDVITCAEVAFVLKKVFDDLKLESFAKVSGSKGMQLYVPLNTAVTYDVTQPFARAVAQLLEQQHPDLILSDMKRSERKGKIFIDWSQNAPHKTTVGVYSLRAKQDQPFVSLPVEWTELARAQKGGRAESLFFTPNEALSRVDKKGDLFEGVLKLKQKLPAEFARQAAEEKPLSTYRKKRDFSITSEPAPKVSRTAKSEERRFVIQKHAASRLHYDFRLEMDGVLKSWAVPKGPPFERLEKRLAMEVEDHPLDYMEFEGTIPKGQYGGGTVMVWDIGAYQIMDGSYAQGKLHLLLDGKKLKGEWVLVRTKGEDGRRWLLMKAGESMKPLSEKKEDSSALTSRSMTQIARENTAQWASNR